MLRDKLKVNIAFYYSQKSLLEDLFSKEWFENTQNKIHPAYKRWALCNILIAQGGKIQYPEQFEENSQLLGAILLDSFVICSATHGNPILMKLGSLKLYGDEKVQKKILTRITDSRQYKELMTEIYTGSWHILEGHKITPLEKEGYPDFKVEYLEYPYPVCIECKNLWSPSRTAIRSAIKDANRQLRQAGKSYGVLNLDVSEAISVGRVENDELPSSLITIRDCISNLLSKRFYKSIGTVVLFWSDYIEHGRPPEPFFIVFRRRSIQIDHKNPFLKVPEKTPLFKSYSYGFWIIWTPRRL